MPRTRTLTLCLLMLAWSLCAGCASNPSPGDSASRLSATDYPGAFQAAKDVLRDEGFRLDRVDARRGVITTIPRSSAGAATPWIPGGQPIDAVADLIQNHARSAVVEFSAPAAPEGQDLRDFAGPIEVRVSVEVLRASRTGRRMDSTLPRRSHFAIDPVAVRTGQPQGSIIVVDQDPHTAARLVKRIVDRAQAGR